MAASLVRCRLCLAGKIFQQNAKRHASGRAYYVLLPEIPPDTPENNPLLRVHQYPQFSAIDPDKAITGCAKLAITYDVELGKHIDHLKDGQTRKDFHSVFNPIEDISVKLNYAWRTAKNLSYVQGADGYRKAFQRAHPQVERAKNERWISTALYHAVKEVKADHKKLDKYQDRLVDMYLLEARLNGIEFTGDDRQKFMTLLSNLVEAKNHFRNRVMLSHNIFSHTIDDFDQVVEFPQDLVALMAVDKSNPSRGPWRVQLNQNIYGPFMEYCSHRLLRWNVWQAYNNRAAYVHDSQNLSNHTIIKDIREHRKDLAVLLGYENFAEMSMETKMAGSVENVLSMIESLKAKFLPRAEEEVNVLQDFAAAEGFQNKLEMWDLAYWRRRHRDHLFKLDENDLSPFFTYPRVLEGLFSWCTKLFGIEFEDHTSDVDVWNPDVSFYKVKDSESGEELAGFYIDPYARPAQKLAGSWVEAGRENSELLGTSPICYVNLNLTPPFGEDGPSLMTVDEAATVFYELGHALQQMLTTVPYSEIAGQRNVEWDTLQTCALVMSQLFYQPAVMSSVSGHHETGEQLPTDSINLINQRRQHLASYDMMRQLYLSAFDMEMYISDDYWSSIMRAVWAEFMPMPLHEDDNHPCSLTQIFSDQYPAAYYSFIWAEMIASDISKSFIEAGLESPEKVAAVGRRFRDTYLSLGGGVSANEVFRRFQGRDPSIDPYIQRHMIQSK